MTRKLLAVSGANAPLKWVIVKLVGCQRSTCICRGKKRILMRAVVVVKLKTGVRYILYKDLTKTKKKQSEEAKTCHWFSAVA
jgi:hypothetical protein